MAMKSFPFDSEFLRINEMGFPEGDRDANSADPDSERTDRVVARLDLTPEQRRVDLFVLTGTPAAPAITRNDKVYELVLANLLVRKGAQEVQLHDITDTRLDADLCGVVVQLAKEVDFSRFFNQFGRFEEMFYTWFEGEFLEWFNEVKEVLSIDAAGNLFLEMRKRPQIHVSEEVPDDWADGDWWYQVMRVRQPDGDGTAGLLELLTTTGYDPALTYHLKDTDSGVTESITNLDGNVLLITEI